MTHAIAPEDSTCKCGEPIRAGEAVGWDSEDAQFIHAGCIDMAEANTYPTGGTRVTDMPESVEDYIIRMERLDDIENNGAARRYYQEATRD